MWKNITLRRCIVAALGSVILAFGLYHVHSFSGVTEGGVLGLTLLLDHWLHLSPAVTGFLLNAVCFLFGWRVLGKEFVVYSAVASLSFSAAYAAVEQFPPLWPNLYTMPLLAAVLGAAFVASALSVMIQVLSYKLRKGKRVFKMAPLHHHFELMGVSEPRITALYMLLTGVCCALSIYIFTK